MQINSTNKEDLKKALKEIKKLRDEAVENGQDQFLYRDQPVLVSYAKYLIQHLEVGVR